MATTDDLLKVLEKCQISPPSKTLSERTLSLTFLDLQWLLQFPIHQLFFYDFPISISKFIESFIPNFKHSLSITLQHFFPFTSKLIVFASHTESGTTRKPEIRFTEGDSVALTIAECSLDFDDLVGNHPRESGKFYRLVPTLERSVKRSEFIAVPLFCVQVTIFPNRGISVGLTNHHILGDASSIFLFFKAWTWIARYGKDDAFLGNELLPFYGRVIKYPNSLDEMFLNKTAFQILDQEYKPLPVTETEFTRTTFVLTRSHIDRLKKRLVNERSTTFGHVSSFSVACAYVWSCLAKSRVRVGEPHDKDEVERVILAVDLRCRLDPPLPKTYFGNCLWPCLAKIKTALLVEKNGFLNAAESLGKAISETLKSKDRVIEDAETHLAKLVENVRTLSVSGTPKIEFYDVDFGWGKPRKSETVSIDYSGSISVISCKESPEDLEIGLSLPAKQMDAFIAISGIDLEGTF